MDRQDRRLCSDCYGDGALPRRARSLIPRARFPLCGDAKVLRRGPAFFANALAAIAAAGAPARHFVLWKNCSAAFKVFISGGGGGGGGGALPGAEAVDAGIEEAAALLAAADVLVGTGDRAPPPPFPQSPTPPPRAAGWPRRLDPAACAWMPVRGCS